MKSASGPAYGRKLSNGLAPCGLPKSKKWKKENHNHVKYLESERQKNFINTPGYWDYYGGKWKPRAPEPPSRFHTAWPITHSQNCTMFTLDLPLPLPPGATHSQTMYMGEHLFCLINNCVILTTVCARHCS